MQQCYPMRIMAAVPGLLVLWLLVVPHVALGQTVCTLNSVPCQGRYGAGCYDPAYATCHDGLMCAHATSPCIGRYGAGCYNPAYATCFDGVVCSTPLQPCFGPHGAQCYDPGKATCAAGQRPFRPRHR